MLRKRNEVLLCIVREERKVILVVSNVYIHTNTSHGSIIIPQVMKSPTCEHCQMTVS